VVFDGAWAEKQLGTDLRVRAPIAGASRYLRLLRREPVKRVHRAPAHSLAGGQQLATGALGERLRSDVAEHLVGEMELLACVQAPALAAQPLAVHQVCAGEMDLDAAAGEPLDRFAVEGFGRGTIGQQGARAGLDPQRPAGGARAGSFLELSEGAGGDLGPIAAGPRFDELD
jgi:hypothetical protein